ncbi:MAG: hypothetical protein ACSHYA_01275 [Opitutaceae bacterium]
MAKRSSPRKRTKASCSKTQAVTCTALLVVDQAPFLKKALSACKRLRNELHKKQALLSDFEEQDRTAYWQWFNSTYGKRLTQIRELQEEVNAYQFIVHHLSNCSYFDYKAVPELYEKLFELKQAGDLFSYEPPKQPDPYGYFNDDDEEEDDDEWDDADDWDDDDWDEDDEESDDDDMRSFFERMFGGGGSGGASDEVRDQEHRKQKAEEDIRFKTCYRNLAKRLHPDRSKLEESIRERRWHEIQEAYQQNDYEALLRVEAICDMDDTGLSVKLGLARLRDLAAYHKSHLVPIRQALREAKQDVAFGFFRNGASAKLKREVASDLKYDRMNLKESIEQMEYVAVSIRDEIAERLRQDKAANERAIRRAKEKRAERAASKSAPKAKNKQSKPKVAARPQPKPVKPARQKEPEPEDPRQMSFF